MNPCLSLSLRFPLQLVTVMLLLFVNAVLCFSKSSVDGRGTSCQSVFLISHTPVFQPIKTNTDVNLPKYQEKHRPKKKITPEIYVRT